MKKILFLTFVTLLFLGCKKEEILKEESQNSEAISQTKSGSGYTNNEGTLVLGQQINNPYTVANMTTAYNNVKSENDPAGLIGTSHYYVRYLPSNEDQLDDLVESGLELFNYPLDYEILENGVTYHDPTIPAENITWQYTVVPENQTFDPNIQHEIISQLFIPELIQEESESIFNGVTINNTLLDNILVEAYLLSGHQNELDQDQQGKWGLKPKWTPAGKITVYDDFMDQQLDLEGVKVRAIKFMVIKTDRTDSDGDYTINDVRGNVNYSIKWSNLGYDIRDVQLFQAFHNGPNKNSGWDLDIVSDRTFGFATVHRAAYRYIYKDRGGLSNPKPLITRLRIRYVHQQSSGATGLGVHFGNYTNLGILNNIKVWGLDGPNSRYSSQKLFHTTIHELAHAAHLKKMNSPFGLAQVKKIIRESWPEAVGYYITKIEYDALGAVNFDEGLENNFVFNLQASWGYPGSLKNYNPLFIDVCDNYNQRLRESNTCIAGSSAAAIVGSRSDVCYIDTPPAGTSANITAAQDFFSYIDVSSGTPQEIPYIAIPAGATPVIRNNKYYIEKSPNWYKPDDRVFGYSMVDLENALPIIKNLVDYELYLKATKPAGVTFQNIDDLIFYYDNL